MRKVHPWYAFVLPAFAESIFIVKETKLLNDVVHYKVSINLRLVGHVLFVCFTQLANLVDIKPLVRVNFEHTYNQTSQFLTVFLGRRWKITFRYPLKQLVQIEVFFVRGSEWTSECTEFIRNAAHAPNIRLPVISFALEYLRTHIQWCSNSWKGFKSLRTQLTTQT